MRDLSTNANIADICVTQAHKLVSRRLQKRNGYKGYEHALLKLTTISFSISFNFLLSDYNSDRNKVDLNTSFRLLLKNNARF